MSIPELCRLCLSESTKATINLYQQNSATELTRSGSILKQHFWFDFGINESEKLSKTICEQCWKYVEEFDDFYNSIKVKHQKYYCLDLNYSCVSFVDDKNIVKICDVGKIDIGADVKEEPLVDAGLEESKVAAILGTDDSDDSDNYIVNNGAHNSSSSESEEDYKPSQQPRRKIAKTASRPKRKKAEKNDSDNEFVDASVELIRKYFKMQCDQCTTQFGTFTDATTHYKNVHSLDHGYLYCCERKFNNLTMIKQHSIWHENPDSFKCNTCNKSYASRFSLKNHLLIHAKNDAAGKPTKSKKMDYPQGLEQKLMIRNHFKMECDLCDEKFDCFGDATVHFDKVHEQTGYLICCDKKFFKVARAIEHCQWHENPELFKCDLCQKIFNGKKSLFTHMSNMHAPEENKIYKCTLCARVYPKEYLLANHNRNKHDKPVEKNFECYICGHRFGAKGTLKFHIENVHENKNVKMCDICAKSFKSLKCYKMHYLNEHTNIDQKVQCESCGKWLKHQDALKYHMRTHKALPAECKICGRISPNKKALRQHMKITHSPPTLKCTFCDKMFKKQYVLKEHIASHTGDTDLYKCSFCPETFRLSSNMYKHRKQMHPYEYADSKAKGLIA